MPLEVAEYLKEEIRCSPWEITPYGVVSLAEVLEFAARDYLELSYQFGMFLGAYSKRQPHGESLGEYASKLLAETKRLGLTTTAELIGNMILEMVKTNPGKILPPTMPGGDFRIEDATFSTERLAFHFESIHSSMKAELGTTLLKAIPRDRANYANPKWLEKFQLVSKFPTSFAEFERSGMCHALGQSTASVFHSMRALESGLAALAKPFGVSSAHENWQNIINEVEREVRAIGLLSKTQQKLDDEKFFGAAVSHLYFVKNAWRNHVAHTRDSYSDDEAHKILQRSVEFIESLCPRLQE